MRTVSLVIAAALLAPAAKAGTGPWTLSGDDASVYVGGEYRTFARIVGGDGSVDGESTALPTPIRFVTVQGIVSYGLLDPLEVELAVPWVLGTAARADAAGCSDLGQRACATTSGLGSIQARAKIRLLDEVERAPLSLAIGAHVRVGDAAHDVRARLTTPTEGQTDLGGFLALGRSGSFGGTTVSYSAWAEAGYLHRLPNATLSDQGVPGDEWGGAAELLVGVGPVVSLGPDLAFSTRSGLDLAAVDMADPDRFAALAVTSVVAGGKLLVRSDHLWTFVVGVSGTVYAENNPPDTVSFSVGLNRQLLGGLPR